MEKVVKIIIVAVFAAFAGWNIFYNSQEMPVSTLVLNNIDALATNVESSDECEGCLKTLYLCKDFGWGGCIGTATEYEF